MTYRANWCGREEVYYYGRKQQRRKEQIEELRKLYGDKLESLVEGEQKSPYAFAPTPQQVTKMFLHVHFSLGEHNQMVSTIV